MTTRTDKLAQRKHGARRVTEQGQTMTANLIGYPRAGVASDYIGNIIQLKVSETLARARARAEYLTEFGAEVFQPVARLKLDGAGWQAGAGTIEPRRTDWGLLPPDVASMGARTGGDITGATGHQVKRARAIGAGEDPEVKRAREDQEWQECTSLAARVDQAGAGQTATERAEQHALQSDLDDLRERRAAIVAETLAEHEEGKRILTLAGGAGYGRKVIGLNSGGMAARAARYMKNKRGCDPSETSLQEAGAAAAAAMWFQWQTYSALLGDIWNDNTVHHLAAYGWRAAFNSFRRDQAQGRKGDRADQEKQSGAMVAIESVNLEVERESLNAWARDRQGRIFDDGDQAVDVDRRNRRAVLKWIASVLDVRAKGRTGAAERARFSVLARLIHGRDIATAARGAGFATGRACLESFRSGKVWARLGAAICGRKSARDQRLLAARARAVKLAMEAIKSQRAARAGAGKLDLANATARRVVLFSGASSVSTVKYVVYKVTRPAVRRVITGKGIAGAGAVHPMARQWSQATTARGQAVAIAKAARAELARARAQRLADFDKGTTGLRAGWLR
jgi:hypothetical protein